MANEIGASSTGAAIGLVGDLATTFINRKFQKEDWNKQVAHEQATYNRNRADYLADLENERAYNSPSQQLARLRDAGLNPNLMNGGSMTTGMSSSAQVMPGGSMASPSMNSAANFGSMASSANAIASGLAASSNAEVNARKADAEIANIKSKTFYQDIENAFLKYEKEQGLAEGAQRIAESIQRCNESASKIDLNNSSIKLNGHKIDLIDKQASTEEQNRQLAAARTFMTNLEAEKLEKLMPYVQAYKEAEIINLNCRSEAAKHKANLDYTQACINMLEEAKLQGLLDAGIVDEEIARLKANTASTIENAKYAGQHAKAALRTANNSLVLGIGNLALGTAGIILGSRIPKVPGPSGLYLPGNINSGGQSWILK